jgi:hypothetical protein
MTPRDGDTVAVTPTTVRPDGDFWLDILGDDISDTELAVAVVRHLGLLLVDAVGITEKSAFVTSRKGSRGMATGIQRPHVTRTLFTRLSRPHAACDSVEVLTLLTADSNPRPWNDIPGVVLVGIVMGICLLIVAIRAMFKKK